MKRWLLSAAAVALVVGTGLVAGPAHATESPGQCTTSHSNEHINSSLVVPRGAVCRLYNVQVAGSITVQPGGALLVSSGTTSGGTPSSIGGGVTGSSAYVNIVRTTVIGLISLTAPQSTSFSSSEGIGGGQLCSNTIGGVSVSSSPATGGGYAIGGGSCESYGSTGSAYGNHVRSNVSVNNNQSLVSIEGNTIDGSLTCAGNNPPPEVGGNSVAGATTGQCRVVEE